jgi:ABC-type Fe3+/spermidine/putrescine transport system ATPase subunit
MIRIKGLTIRFKSFRISDLDIEIGEKEFHFLLGPTGSGKTLILESIAGFNKPEKGRIWIGEKEVQSLPPEEREISYVPQDLALFPHLKVKDNVLYGVRARRLNVGASEEYVRTLIHVMKIEHLLERYPNNLSGGEKKRVALIRALATRPKLLLLDEPLSGLDPSIKEEIRELLKSLHASFHPTILCVTHDFEEAYLLGDKITIYMDGKAEQVGSKDDVFLRPCSREVARFLGMKNLYPAKVSGRVEFPKRLILEVNGHPFSVPGNNCGNTFHVGQKVDLYVRPEEVMILREEKPIRDALKQNILQGSIVDITDRRRDYAVHVQTQEGNLPFEIAIPNYAFRNLNLSEGKTVRISLRDESLWVMPCSLTPDAANEEVA